MEEQRIGRPCLACRSSDRRDVETALLDGLSLSRVSRMFRIGPDSLRRHVEHHLAPEAREAILNSSEGLGAVSIVRRVRAIADAARDAREVAYADGRIALALRAGDAENRALSTLVDRLGITTEEVIETAGETVDILKAFRLLDPGAARILADAFRKAKRSDIASALDERAERMESELALEASA